MTGNLRPYPEYKDSGVDWLGAIPIHWTTRRIKSLSIVKRGASPRPIGDPRYFSEQGEYSWVRISDVTASKTKYLEHTKQQLSEIGKSYSVALEPGSLFLSIAGSVGKPIITNIKCCIHDGFVYFPTFRGNAHFLYYVFASGLPYAGLGKLGTQLNLNTDTVGKIVIGFPSPDEQDVIVHFLDVAERRIRRYIRAKQKLIKLLNEQKQTIIQQAVTRGLNPNASMKDSEIEGVGMIPEHWDVRLNQRIFKENIRPYEGTEEIQLSLSQIDGLIPKNQMKERSLQTSTFKNWKITLPGDLVLNRFKAHLGVFFATTLRGIVTFHYGVFEPQIELRTKFYEYLYHTAPYKGIYAWRSNGMTVGLQNLSNQNFYNVRTLVPPIEEQDQILDYIEKSTATLDNAIDVTKREIDYINEFRVRLIGDIVTGKVDVRGLMFEMPEEFDNDELIDVDEDNLLEDDELEEVFDGE